MIYGWVDGEIAVTPHLQHGPIVVNLPNGEQGVIDRREFEYIEDQDSGAEIFRIAEHSYRPAEPFTLMNAEPIRSKPFVTAADFVLLRDMGIKFVDV